LDYQDNAYSPGLTFKAIATTAECNEPGVTIAPYTSVWAIGTVLSSPYIWRADATADTSFELPKFTTTPTTCRANKMAYEVVWGVYITSNSLGVVTSLNTNMDKPTVAVKKKAFTTPTLKADYRKSLSDNKLYIKTPLGTKITTTNKFLAFTVYIADPDCDNPTVTDPSSGTKTKAFSHLIAANAATIWTITGTDLYTAGTATSSSTIKTCPLGLTLDTSALSTHLKGLITFDALTHVLKIAKSTDNDTAKAAMGKFTFKVKVVSQKSVAIAGKEYSITLTYDHSNCATFSRTYTTGPSNTLTSATKNKWDSHNSSTATAVTMPTETAVATSATDSICKYDYSWTSTTTSTTKLKTAYTGKTTFTV